MPTPQVDFLAIDTTRTNIQDQTDFAASSLPADGCPVNYIVPSPVLNKLLSQSSSIAAALAQAVANITGDNMIDDGDIAALTATIQAAFAAAQTPPQFVLYTASNGSAPTPANCTYLEFWARGSGGGGGGAGTANNTTAGTAGTGGGTVSFDGVVANGGAGGAGGPDVAQSADGGAGGSGGTGSTGVIQRSPGLVGGAGVGVNNPSPESGNGGLGGGSDTVSSPTANTGAGGAGGPLSGTIGTSGAGGGQGELVHGYRNAPAATYAIVINNPGTGGANGGGGGGTDGVGGSKGWVLVKYSF